MKKYFRKAITSVMAIVLMAVSVGAIPALQANAASKNVTIYFKDNQGWGTAYYYACTADTGSTIGAAWPGTKMTAVGDNWYSATIPSAKAVKVVLNNNAKPKAKQTADVTGTDGKGLQLGSTYYLVPGASSDSNGAVGYGGGTTITVTTTKPADFPAAAAASASTAPKDATPTTGDSNTAAAAGAIGAVSLAAACVLLGKEKARA